MLYEDNIILRFATLKLKAAARYNISPEKCHIGHLVLEAMLLSPNTIHQIDGVTEVSESNASIAVRTASLASAMNKAGIVPGDAVFIMGPNHMDLAVPYYACHYNGYAMCSVDPMANLDDLRRLFPYIFPKMVFCQKACVEKVEEALDASNMKAPIIIFDDPTNDLKTFVQKYNGTEVGFRPAVDFDTSKTPAWLMLTSGTTGLPKVAIMTFDTIYNGVIEWWDTLHKKITLTMTMTNTQWLSALMFYLSTPLKPFTRLQSSQPLNAPLMIKLINKYRPDATAWTPFLLGQFVIADNNMCDLSCLKTILIGGSAMEKQILEKFKLRCPAELRLAYGMTELLVPVFDFDEMETPFGSTGKPFSKYQYKLVDDEHNEVDGIEKHGELWMKGNTFFKGYLNNSEETSKVLTEDGWLKTGDIFRRDENNYFYFVERKKILIRYLTNWLLPIQFEEVIKRHPGVAEVCVVGVPDPKFMEVPVAAVMKKNGTNLDAQEIFDLVKVSLPEPRRLHGGLFFVDSFPETVSGKINRSKVLEIAKSSQRIMAK